MSFASQEDPAASEGSLEHQLFSLAAERAGMIDVSAGWSAIAAAATRNNPQQLVDGLRTSHPKLFPSTAQKMGDWVKRRLNGPAVQVDPSLSTSQKMNAYIRGKMK